MSNRRWPVSASSASSRRVSRSTRNVASPLSRSARATARLRGLWRLLPDPCAKRITPRAAAGRTRSPTRSAPATATRTSRSSSTVAGALSDPRRIGLRHLAWSGGREPLERFHRAGLVEVHHGVELLGQAGLEVVAHPLRVGPIDDADRALQTRLVETGRR